MVRHNWAAFVQLLAGISIAKLTAVLAEIMLQGNAVAGLTVRRDLPKPPLKMQPPPRAHWRSYPGLYPYNIGKGEGHKCQEAPCTR